MRACVRERLRINVQGTAALRYHDVLVLSSTHLNSLKPEIQRRINRRDVNRDVKYAPLHAERGSPSHLSRSLSLSLPFSHVAYIIPHRCSRGRYLYLLACGSQGSEIEFSVSILRSSRPYLSSLSRVPPRRDRPRLAEDLRRRPSS